MQELAMKIFGMIGNMFNAGVHSAYACSRLHELSQRLITKIWRWEVVYQQRQPGHFYKEYLRDPSPGTRNLLCRPPLLCPEACASPLTGRQDWARHLLVSRCILVLTNVLQLQSLHELKIRSTNIILTL